MRLVKQAEHQQQPRFRFLPNVESFTTVPDMTGDVRIGRFAFAVPSEVKDLPTAVSLITRHHR